ncbi:transcriptional regulator [Leclercia adecarboxylata]|uniref:Transcriptional regulator n=1 Tax=Leclercia adecarboxylata TaxID=83655 RepID=A0A4U9IRD2_9ENTR|nr:transcriptional regulator [Leclercia adecarboxylata]
MWVINEINSVSWRSSSHAINRIHVRCMRSIPKRTSCPLKVQVCINYLTDYFVQVAALFQEMRARKE